MDNLSTNAISRRRLACSALARAVWLVGTLTLLGGCEKLVGLKDRQFTDTSKDAGTDAATADLCPAYCKDVLDHCSTEKKLDGYKSIADCTAVCKHFPAGKPNAKDDNSVACRAHYASLAGGVESDTTNCPAAAPGGGSPDAGYPTCGNNCQSYCDLYSKVCPEFEIQFKQTNCMTECTALPDRGTYSADADFVKGDTIQCRLAHLTAAAAATSEDTRKMHCGAVKGQPIPQGHSAIRPLLDGETQFCDLVPFDKRCDDFCKLVVGACGKSYPVYEDEAQCKAICENFPAGDSSADGDKDTLACRRWHAYFALTENAQYHCSHAGPIGDGHCGTPKCKPFCAMLERTCKSTFDKSYSNTGACEVACGALDGAAPTPTNAAGYNLNDEEIRKNSLQCRVNYLAQAAAAASGTDIGALCTRALPETACSSAK